MHIWECEFFLRNLHIGIFPFYKQQLFKQIFTLKRIFLLAIFFVALGTAVSMSAQEKTYEFSVTFGDGKTDIDRMYENNSTEVNRLLDLLNTIKDNPSLEISKVQLSGFTSLESTHEKNVQTSQKRAKSLEDLIRSVVNVRPSDVSYNPDYINWPWLKERLRSSGLPYKDQAIAIINQPRTMMDYYAGFTRDRRIFELRWLGKSSVWNYMEKNYFPQMRRATAVITVTETPKSQTAPPKYIVVSSSMDTPETTPAPTSTSKAPEYPTPIPTAQLRSKSNNAESKPAEQPQTVTSSHPVATAEIAQIEISSGADEITEEIEAPKVLWSLPGSNELTSEHRPTVSSAYAEGKEQTTRPSSSTQASKPAAPASATSAPQTASTSTRVVNEPVPTAQLLARQQQSAPVVTETIEESVTANVPVVSTASPSVSESSLTVTEPVSQPEAQTLSDILSGNGSEFTITIQPDQMSMDGSNNIVVKPGTLIIKPERLIIQSDNVVMNDSTSSSKPSIVYDFMPRGHIKTNLVGWALAQVNFAFDFDFGPHWSFSLPVYYSGWNYFQYDLKFRTLDFKPEFRWWSRRNNTGFYLGAHAGFTLFNYAFKGEYRYTNQDRNMPAIGGGLSIGYRVPISHSGRWSMEFGLSGGVYYVQYSKYLNVPYGEFVEDASKTYFGLDGVSVSFLYSFDLRKKNKVVPPTN